MTRAEEILFLRRQPCGCYRADRWDCAAKGTASGPVPTPHECRCHDEYDRIMSERGGQG